MDAESVSATSRDSRSSERERAMIECLDPPVEPSEQIDQALEPGEKIVWSDRPHGLLSAVRRTAREEPWTFVLAAFAFAFDAWVASSIAGRLEIGAEWKRPTPLFYLVLAALFAFVLI